MPHGDVGRDQPEKFLGCGVLLGGQAHRLTDRDRDRARFALEFDAGLGEADSHGTFVLGASLALQQAPRFEAFQERRQRAGLQVQGCPKSLVWC